MTSEKLISVMKFYDDYLKSYTYKPEQIADYSLSSDDLGVIKVLDHCCWMVEEFLSNCGDPMDEETKEKGMRWLGFIQGILFNVDFFSIEQLRDHSRS